LFGSLKANSGGGTRNNYSFHGQVSIVSLR
jgi:hypothetical protein